jgi:adenylate kinase
MKIIFVGPPGAGKGTQAARLARLLGVPHVASGDLLRAIRAEDTPLGNEAKRYMDAGMLVPDDLTIRIIEERLSRPDAEHGVILDGFPRTVGQAKALDRSLARRNGRATNDDQLVLFIKASRDVVLERMRGRWVCQQCTAVYNIPDIAPSEEGHCDVCGAPLFKRHDEIPEIQVTRYAVYERDTLPILDHYRQHGMLVEIEGEQDVESVTRDILAAIEARKADLQPRRVAMQVGETGGSVKDTTLTHG